MGQNIKQVKGKIIFKHQTAAEWDLSNNGAGAQYVPDVGERVLYDPDETHPYTREKFGDGEHIVKDLPFSGIHFENGEGENAIVQEATTGHENTATGDQSAALGADSKAEADYAFAAGSWAAARERAAFAGNAGDAKNVFSAAFNTGYADGDRSFAKGQKTHAKAYASETGGIETTVEETATAGVADGKGSVAAGPYSTAHNLECSTSENAQGAYAGGEYSQAKHRASFVHGENLTTSRDFQAVFGDHNKDDEDAMFIVAEGGRNLLTVKEWGTAQIAGSVVAGADIISNGGGLQIAHHAKIGGGLSVGQGISANDGITANGIASTGSITSEGAVRANQAIYVPSVDKVTGKTEQAPNMYPKTVYCALRDNEGQIFANKFIARTWNGSGWTDEIITAEQFAAMKDEDIRISKELASLKSSANTPNGMVVLNSEGKIAEEAIPDKIYDALNTFEAAASMFNYNTTPEKDVVQINFAEKQEEECVAFNFLLDLEKSITIEGDTGLIKIIDFPGLGCILKLKDCHLEEVRHLGDGTERYERFVSYIAFGLVRTEKLPDGTSVFYVKELYSDPKTRWYPESGPSEVTAYSSKLLSIDSIPIEVGNGKSAIKFNDLENNLSNGVNTIVGGTKSSAGVSITKVTDLESVGIRLWWPADSVLVDDGTDENNKTIHYYKRNGCIILFDNGGNGVTDGYYLQRFRASVLRDSLTGKSTLNVDGWSERDTNNATQITLMGEFGTYINGETTIYALNNYTVSLSQEAWDAIEAEKGGPSSLNGVNYYTYSIGRLNYAKHPDETTLYYVTNASKTTATEIKSAIAVGTSCMSCNSNSAVFGNSCLSFGQANFVAGSINVVDNYFGAAFGVRNQVFGMAGFAEGGENYLGPKANRAHIEGSQGFAYGPGCHVEGTGNIVNVSSNAGHAEGNKTVVSGSYAHAQNLYTIASGNSSHAGGEHTEAKHTGSFAHGLNLVTGKDYQAVVGQNNKEDSNAFFVVGVGANIEQKKNQFVVNQGGVKIIDSLDVGDKLTTKNLEATGTISLAGAISLNSSWATFNKGSSFKAKAYLDAGATAKEITITNGAYLGAGMVFSTIGADGTNNAGGVRTNTLYLRNKSNQDETLTYNDVKNLKSQISNYRVVRKEIVFDTKACVESGVKIIGTMGPIASISGGAGGPNVFEVDGNTGLFKLWSAALQPGEAFAEGTLAEIVNQTGTFMLDCAYTIDTPDNPTENPEWRSKIYCTPCIYELLDEQTMENPYGGWDVNGTNNVAVYTVEEV